ncbi:MAG: inorganic phosphate transporter [Deltaproteobacteria bacterium]|jgi:PiT family inorganic phosphate transporter|nr:inorganic phosphate transporter [Deltaproteobacteria bacterium]
MVLWIAGGLAMYMAWAIGANDVANAMGTSVGSGALTIRRAVIVAAVLEFSGALFVGGHVTDTVRKGMLDMQLVQADPQLLLYGMLGALAAAATLLAIATAYGLPVSTTHSIVGAIVGFGSVALGAEAVNWSKVAQIVASWFTSPLLGGVLAFLIFHLIRRLILDRSDPVEAGRRWGPLFFFVVTFVMGLVTLFKGLKNLKLDLDLPEALAWSATIGAVGALLGRVFLRQVRVREGERPLRSVERVFAVLQVLAACAVAFAHGSNDVANAIGPLAAVVHVARGAAMAGEAPLEAWMLMVGGIGIVFGLATWGYRVMETVGRRITELTPSRGFAATIAATLTIVLASRLGIPVSTTHILVGSVLGVGLARGIGALNLGVLGKIMVSWIATLPIAALFSVFFLYFFKGLLTPW